eukprot:gene14518-17138_t
MSLKCIGGVAVGAAFGVALHRANVYLPSVIQGQMAFTNHTMLKMFMTASLTSSLAMTFMDYNKIVVLEHLPVTWLRNIFGGLIMGVGIQLTGSCPGTVLAQVGAGIPSAVYTLIGGLAGAVIYGMVDKQVSALMPESKGAKPTVQQRLSIPMYKATIPFAMMLVSVLYGIESLVPWQLDSGVSSSITSLASISTPIWSPYAAGAVIGLLQIPNHLLSNGGLGTSSAYVTVSAKICNTFSCSVDYFKKYSQGLRSVYGPLLNVGIVLGAYLSSRSSSAIVASNLIHSPFYYIASGAVLIAGARMANGCTSGQGLTGMSKLEIGSILAVASLFIGGMITSFLLK